MSSGSCDARDIKLAAWSAETGVEKWPDRSQHKKPAEQVEQNLCNAYMYRAMQAEKVDAGTAPDSLLQRFRYRIPK